MKILVADDEPLARRRLIELLADVPYARVAGEAANGNEVLNHCAAHPIDCVLLDIKMPLVDGLEAARRLGELPNPPAVVFCTAYDAHALAAFEARATDYLLKPVRRERLLEALQRVQRLRAGPGTEPPTTAAATSGPRTHICARVRGNLKRIAVEDTAYFLADDKYVAAHAGDGTLLIEDTLKALEREFRPRFVRIHRNCLVAVAHIQELRRDAEQRWWVLLRGRDERLEVSRRNLPQVRKLMKDR